MATAVIIPRQGQSVESCILTSWYKKRGDRVAAGELLFSYETDKAAFDEEAKVDGILLDIFYEEGEEIPVLTTIAAIGKSGESVADLKNMPEKSLKEERPVERKAEKLPVSEPVKAASFDPPDKTEEIRVSPRAKALAAKLGVDVFPIEGSGPEGRIMERDIILASKRSPKITPLAREIMKKENLVFNKEKVGKRVTRKDLHPSDKMTDTEEVRIPLTNIRKKIAASVMQSLRNAAQLTHHTSADATKLLDLRKQIKSQLSSGNMPDITLNDMVCFAVTKALMNFSGLNGHFLGEEIRLFKSVNLGFAVDTDRGLMVPVVRKAERLSLDELSIEMNNLVERCKRGDIDPDLIRSESAGFTVSNLGAYEIEMFTPIINLPQMAILGVNAIVKRPVEREDGTIGMIPYIGLSLTYDHRALDGGPASLFLKEIKEQIENFDGR